MRNMINLDQTESVLKSEELEADTNSDLILGIFKVS